MMDQDQLVLLHIKYNYVYITKSPTSSLSNYLPGNLLYIYSVHDPYIDFYTYLDFNTFRAKWFMRIVP